MPSLATQLITVAEPLVRPLLAGVRRLERRLGPEDDWVEDDRRVIFEAADRLLRPLGRPTIRNVGDSDHIASVDASPDAVEELLAEEDYQRNLLSSRKYRDHHNGGRQWAVGSWVLDPRDQGWQHHVYLFESRDGGTDVYAHREASVRNPDEHHGGDEMERGVSMGLLEVLDPPQ